MWGDLCDRETCYVRGSPFREEKISKLINGQLILTDEELEIGLIMLNYRSIHSTGKAYD